MEELHIRYDLYASWRELPEDEQELVNKAYEIASKAYAPYSQFYVGASVLLSNGTVVLGSNQENVAFPSGICAERTALFYAGANFSGEKILKIVVVAKGELTDFDSLLSPCGGCRQVMLESEQRQNAPIEILLVSQNEKTIRLKSAKDLLPFAFVAGK